MTAGTVTTTATTDRDGEEPGYRRTLATFSAAATTSAMASACCWSVAESEALGDAAEIDGALLGFHKAYTLFGGLREEYLPVGPSFRIRIPDTKLCFGKRWKLFFFRSADRIGIPHRNDPGGCTLSLVSAVCD